METARVRHATAVVEDICHGRQTVVEQHVHLVLARGGLVPRQLLRHLQSCTEAESDPEGYYQV